MRKTNTIFYFLVAVVFFNATLFAQEDSITGAISSQEKPVLSQIELTANWIPFADSKYKFAEMWETLKNLRPAVEKKSYSADELSAFLPKPGKELGETWDVSTTDVVRLLKQFHPGATHRLHHGGPQGAFACIASENESFVRVRTRAHAEFKLKDGIYLPSQFAGNIVINRKTNEIVAFKLSVPPRRNNVDLNWHREPAEGEMWSDGEGNVIPARATTIADIGYCERMELVGGDWVTANQIEWDQELTFRVVDTKFQKLFYASAAIDWIPWEEAVAKSQETGKPLHVVALFGVLDDESC